MSIAASDCESGFSGDEYSAALPSLGTVTLSESDPALMAMLSRAAESVRLEWNPPPCPEPSRLDDWFLRVARAGSQRPAPLPFFREVHEELTRSWTSPFTARNRPGPSMVERPRVMRGSPGGAVGCDAIVSKHHCHLAG